MQHARKYQQQVHYVKIHGALVCMLQKIELEVRKDFATHRDDNNKILCTSMLNLLRRTLKALILYCKILFGGTSGIRCKLNLRDYYATNKVINTKQCTLLQYADSTKASYVDSKINGKFTEWAKLTCRSNKLGHAKVHRDRKCNCLGITIDC